MKICKNCGPLSSEFFNIRSSGYVPNLCSKCERAEAARRRREAYANSEKRDRIRAQNASWRSKNAAELTAEAKVKHGNMDKTERRRRRDVILANVPRVADDWAKQFSNTADIVKWARSGNFLPDTEPIDAIFKRLSHVEMRDPLPQLNVGLKYLDNINPQRYDAHTKGKMSVRQAYADDSEIIRIIKYILGTNRVPTHELLMRNLKFNAIMPSHFFPSAAVALINEYATGGDVFDPFLGWGGRILGAVCSRARSFSGTDTQKMSVLGSDRIGLDFGCMSSVKTSMACCDFSDFMRTTCAKFDMILSSPPFFDTEDYGSEGIRGRDWVSLIAKPLVSGAERLLSENGVMAIHAQDRPKMAVLSILLACFLGAGFEIVREYKYGKKPGQSILIFKKVVL